MCKKYLFSSLILLSFCFYSCSGQYEKIEPIEHPYKLSSQIELDMQTKVEGWRFQAGAWAYAEIGNYAKMLSTWDTGMIGEKKKPVHELEIFYSKYQVAEALPYLLKRIKSEQIVIINEAHQQPLHRVFTYQLLNDMYQQGFRYLGLETLDERDTLLNVRKYSFTDSGFYSKEPQFGELIREALRIGFQLFAYEKIEEGLDREVEQAKIIQKMIDKDPTGKFIIHCGFSHAAEGHVPSWGKAMAGRLTELSGINPFTINQTDFTELGTRSFEDPLYQHLDPDFPVVYLDANEESYKYEVYPERFDIMIFHARTKYIHQRPEWIFHSGKKPVEVKLSDLDIELPALVMAFYPDEDYKKAVPADIQELTNTSDSIYLALKPGKYNVIIQNVVPEARKYVMEVE